VSSGYRHSQSGTVTIVTVGAAAAAITLSVFLRVLPAIHLVFAGLLLACLQVLGSLTVEVGQGAVRLHFGHGVVRREFRVGQIRRVAVVRNRWYTGWGIHRLQSGWLYNVSGLDAVEIELGSGEVNRIGTDEPQELAAAIREAAGLPAD
jgi:hypothetical protein